MTGVKGRERKSESGQATVELALTIALVIGFVFFQIQSALVMAFGNYAQYATFMAARAYLSGGVSIEDSEDRARTVLSQMVSRSEGDGSDRWPAIARSFSQGSNNAIEIGVAPEAGQMGRDASSWMVGVRYTFQSRLFFISLGMGGGGPHSRSESNANALTLSSESWLGREPTYGECMSDLRDKEATYVDNGC